MPYKRKYPKGKPYTPGKFSAKIGAYRKKARAAPPSRMRRRNIRTGGYLGIEKKFLDTVGNGVTISESTDATGGEVQPTAGCTGCLSAPAQGDGESNRDGRKCVIKEMMVHGVVTVSAINKGQGTLSDANYVMVALVLDTQANGATITSEQVFVNGSTSAAQNINMFRNLEYASRYRVVASRIIKLKPYMVNNSVAGGAYTESAIAVRENFKLSWSGDIPVTFTGTTADVANVTDNAFHLIAFADNAEWATTCSFLARCRFVG